ncbi:hypothetical protein [Methylobacterium sp. J-067]|uniref:hypothetical protein n=1 Tax=Methylobacterium sp. J-067 TaxID=2836648 RepID=UPI001FBB9ABB|nr:hypothetical protein [Methylobacterium sp. J-067]MCJ2026445.1 hypothetical protein [Methylobacterium sp. J-067]
MRYEHGKPENRRRAAFLLGDLRRKLGSSDDALETVVTARAEASMPYWRLSNVAGVHVYRMAEGWHADLAFRNLPVGVPALVGSAVPWGTREEALACAVRQLTLCQGREEIPLPETVDTWPLFVFDHVEMPIEPSEIPGMVESLAREGYGDEQVVGRLAYLRQAIAGDEPLTLETFHAADEEMRRKLMVACMVAMALGRTQFTPADGIWADHMPTVPRMM